MTIRSHRGHRLQDRHKDARFNNPNRGGWEKMYIEKCGIAVGNRNC